MKENKYYVYQHLNPLTKEIFYIGIGYGNRAYNKGSRNRFWNNYVKKHGFEVQILFDKITRDKAAKIEIELIEKYGRRVNNTGVLVNICDGGEGNRGYTHSEEWKKNHSKSMIGKKLGPLSQEAKDKLSKKLTGQKHPTKMKAVLQYDLDGNFIKEWESVIEAKSKTNIKSIFENASGYKNNKVKTAGGFIWIYKNQFSKELLQEKLQIGNSKKKPTPEKAKYNISKNLCKPILQYDLKGNFIKEWSSQKEIGEFYQICPSSISNCCRGKRESSQNFIWKFKN